MSFAFTGSAATGIRSYAQLNPATNGTVGALLFLIVVIICSFSCFHSAQLHSPSLPPIVVGSLNSSKKATVVLSLYFFEIISQNSIVSFWVVLYMSDWYFSVFRLPMLCQSMITYMPASPAYFMPSSNSDKYFS